MEITDSSHSLPRFRLLYTLWRLGIISNEWIVEHNNRFVMKDITDITQTESKR
jgi:hypothetical protein